MDFSKVTGITVPEGKVIKIVANGVTIWEEAIDPVAPSYKNWVQYSTEADGTTIYNGGLGYKDGYRIRSSGAEAEQSYGTITGYIPYVKGEKLYIYPSFTGGNSWNTVSFYDSTFTNLGQITDSGGGYGICSSERDKYKTQVINGVSVLDISAVTVSGVENVAYVRVGNEIVGRTGGNASITSGSEMIITKDE